MKLAWITDPHLNFVEPDDRRRFYESVRDSSADAVLLGGDIGEAPTVLEFLRDIHNATALPVYFVLGNHDFYGGSITEVRTRVAAASSPQNGLTWLSGSGVIGLDAKTALIGHDGWADGRLGDFFASPILLNDYILIQELAAAGPDKVERYRLLNQLGDDAAASVEPKLQTACRRFDRVILLTHVPPFYEACWHEGAISNGHWLPHFASKVMGEMLLRVMSGHPEKSLLVLCGHTHSSGIARFGNIEVRTGSAEYGNPAIQDLIEI